MLACWGLVLLAWPTTAAETPGADLARRLGCFACHAGPGYSRDGEAVSLAGLSHRLSRNELVALLHHPRRFHPQARMPNYAHLRPEEMEALVDFLLHLK